MSLRRPSIAAAAIGLALAAGGASAARAAPRVTAGSARGPITIDAAKTDVNGRTRQAVLRGVVITQDGLRITADRAEASAPLDFSNSRWTFIGHVHITSGQHGDLQSDQATVAFHDSRMQSALATGHPAQFQQVASKTGLLARGHADSIEYTFDTATVRLSGDAWLEYGNNQISNSVLVYDIRQQKLRSAGAPSQSERVHITIQPKKHTAAPSSPAPPRAAPSSAAPEPRQ